MPVDILSRPPIAAQERIRYGSHPSQFFDVFPAHAAPKKLAIMIHGGFWRSRYDLQHASHLCAALAGAGITAASLEYRRVGTDGGWPSTFDDVLAGRRAVLRHFGKRISPVVIGHSAGGHLALRLACEDLPMTGAVALAPVACLRLCFAEGLGNGAVVDFLGGSPQQVPENYDAADPCARESKINRILVHGVQDDTVPVSTSRAFVEARKSDPGSVTLSEVPGAHHLDVIDPESAAWPVVLGAVKQFCGS